MKRRPSFESPGFSLPWDLSSNLVPVNELSAFFHPPNNRSGLITPPLLSDCDQLVYSCKTQPPSHHHTHAHFFPDGSLAW